jgi:hypothetical protein
MRRVLSVLLLVPLLLLLPAAAHAAGGGKPGARTICAKRGHTVEASRVARVFEVDRGGDRTLYGCLRADGRRRALASWYSCECSVGDDPAPGVELHAGRFVALTHYPSCGPFPCEAPTTYELRDLRSGRRVAPVADVWQVVTGPGFFAYEDGRVVIVRGGSEQVADPGPGIERFSLAVAGTRLYWMRDGAPYSVAH